MFLVVLVCLSVDNITQKVMALYINEITQKVMNGWGINFMVGSWVAQ